jgi:hypothetical protein
MARIPHGKGERRILPRHDQSQISARFDGNPTVDPCIRDSNGCLICQRLALAAIFGQPRQNFQEIIRCFSIAACFAAPIVAPRK